ncbi:hypothetical protein GWI33_010849, partial [Rhynchophorus ferrugineus]
MVVTQNRPEIPTCDVNHGPKLKAIINDTPILIPITAMAFERCSSRVTSE